MRQSEGAQEGCGEHLSNTASLSKPRCSWSIEQPARLSTAVPSSTWSLRISLRTKCQGAFSARKRTCNRQEEQIKRKPKEGDECLTATARSSVEEFGWGEIDRRENERSSKCEVSSLCKSRIMRERKVYDVREDTNADKKTAKQLDHEDERREYCAECGRCGRTSQSS